MRLKRIISTALLAVIAFGGGWMLSKAIRGGALPIGSRLPVLYYRTSQGEHVLLPQPKRYTLVVLWHPRCGHCTSFLAGLRDHRQEFRALRILLLVPDQNYDYDWSGNLRELGAETNVIWAHASPRTVEKTFGRTGLPMLYLFDPNLRLVHRIRGAVKPDYVLEVWRGKEAACGV